MKVKLYDAKDVMPSSFNGTPWAAIFYALSRLLRIAFSENENSFLYIAAAYHFLLNNELEKITDRPTLDAIAISSAIPAWNFDQNIGGDDDFRLQAVLSAWLRYRGTTADFVNIVVQSGASSVSFEYDSDGDITCMIGSVSDSIFYSGLDDDPTSRFFDRIRAFLPISFCSRVTLEENIEGFVYSATTDTLTPATFDDDAETVDTIENTL